MAVELASGYVSLVPSTKGFGAALDKQIGPEVDKAARDAGTRAGDGFTSSFGSGLGKLAAIAATAFAGLQVGNFFKDTILAASDLNETVNKVSVVFGDSAGVVQAWGQTAATALGQSTQQALEAAGTFGNLFRAMGLTSDVSADMSTKLVGLAADLASFNNANPADVLVALKSGLVGETEPLRQFGVNLNDIRIKAEAARLGLVSATVDQDKLSASSEAADKAARKVTEALQKHGQGSQEFADATRDAEQANSKLADTLGGKMPTQLDAATKAQAAYSLIMQDTTLAQGDFERTSGGLANQLRILQAQFKDSSAKIGQAFLPLAVKVVTLLTSKGIPGFAKLGEVLSTKLAHGVDVVTVALQIFHKELDPSTVTGKGIKNLNDVFAHLGDTVRKIGDGIGVFRQTLDKNVKANPEILNLNDVFAHLADFVSTAAGALRTFATDVRASGAAFADGFGKEGADALVRLFDSLVSSVGKLSDKISTGASDIDKSDLQGKFEKIGEKLGGLVKLVDDHKDVFGPIITAVVGLSAAFLGVAKVLPVFSKLSTGLDIFKTAAGLATSPLGQVVLLLTGLGVAAFIAYKKFTPFRAAVDSVVQTFKASGFGAAVDEAGTQFGRLWDIVKPKLLDFRDKALAWINDHAGEIFAGVGTALGGIFSFVGTEILAPLGAWIKDTAAPWLKDKITTEWAPAFSTWVTDTAIPWLLDQLPTYIDAIFKWLHDNEQTLNDKFNEFADGFVAWIKKTAIPKLEEELPGILETLTTWARDNMPKWQNQLAELAVGAVGGIAVAIITHIPDLLSVIPAQLFILGLAMIGGIVAGAVGPDAIGKLQDIAFGIIAFVSGLPEQIATAAVGMWHGIVDAFNVVSSSLTPDNILAFFTDLPGKIAGAAVGMWDGIYDAFKGALNLIIRAWNSLEFKLPSFDGLSIAGHTVIPGFEGPTLGTPDIPELAGGGVFNSPFTGMLKLAETPAARPEIVTPQKLLAATFRKELAAVGAGGGAGPHFGDIVVNGAQASPASIADAVFAKAGWLHFTGRREL